MFWRSREGQIGSDMVMLNDVGIYAPQVGCELEKKENSGRICIKGSIIVIFFRF